ncbi:McrC family protein [Rahnella sp. BCC 1045]|uniref:McrC family protein n=1 Tax=Rahnella sp. BCC 1045 TaxID=2816251 RepID=UPI001C26D66D|nr:McrC family protein [Rahnella sp. BCC 1045]MBU9822915.1 McrC family protein [Rahnella sp. BCC 1045]
MTGVISAFEYDLLGDENAKISGVVPLPSEVFKYLEAMALSEYGCQFLKVTARNNQRLLQVQNYAGMLFTPLGHQLEILPKVGRNLTKEKARETLVTMLSYLSGFRHIQTQESSVQTYSRPLLEIFISQFLQSLSLLLKKGLRSDYREHSDNLTFMKGRLNVSAQLRHNVIHRDKFFVSYEEYSPDNAANRLLHSALNKLSKMQLAAENQQWIQELRFVFDDIPVSRDIDADISQLRFGRNMVHYETPVEWAKLILTGMSPMALQGEAKSLSLLFPMEVVFESFVAQTIADELPPGLTVKSQFSGLSLVRHQEKDLFSLRPDLVIQKGVPAKNNLVMDTKWKLINGNMRNQYGLSQSDLYQMFAYGQKYLAGEDQGAMYLIYPEQDNFTAPIRHHFEFSNTLKLWVVPYRITANQGQRFSLQQ